MVICLVCFIIASISIQGVGVRAPDAAAGKTYPAHLVVPSAQPPVVYVRPWLGELRYWSGVAAGLLFAGVVIGFVLTAARSPRR